MKVQSYAKINLYLKIGQKLKSGYHKLQSVMVPINSHDTIVFEKLTSDEIIIESNNKNLENEENLIYKAAKLLQDNHKASKGIKVQLSKQVPLSAGLGGGSSNAAHALLALNKLWKLNLPEKTLIGYAASLGADVPFFLHNKPQLVEGIGDKLKEIKLATPLHFVMVNPGFPVSTEWAYKEWDKKKTKPKNTADVKALISSLKGKNVKMIAKNMHNDFDPIVEAKYPMIKDIKSKFRKLGCLAPQLTGSGPTVIGLFESVYAAREAHAKLQHDFPFVFLTKTI